MFDAKVSTAAVCTNMDWNTFDYTRRYVTQGKATTPVIIPHLDHDDNLSLEDGFQYPIKITTNNP